LLEPGVEPGFLMVFADPVSSGSFFLSMMNFGRMLGFLARKLTASHSCCAIALGDTLFWQAASFELPAAPRLP
jgi:hypothetical protein